MSATGFRIRSSNYRVLGLWFGSHAYIGLIGLLGAASLLSSMGLWNGFVTSWNFFDTTCYGSVAEFGYLGSDLCYYNTAFFPGLPALMWLGLQFGIPAAVSGLLVSAVASLFASYALYRIAIQYRIHPTAALATWLFAPMSVFLFAPYAEALFCAFTFWAWYFAKSERWVLAGLLAGFAATTRSNALFFTAALIVLFVVSKKRDWRAAPALLIPFLVVGLYFIYLHSITGSWTHWMDVQADTWNRDFTDPITSTINTFRMAFEARDMGFSLTRFPAEILNTFFVLGIGIVLLIKRWWAEATYVFLTILSLMTSEFFQSTPRATLVLFPIWLILGIWVSKKRWFAIFYFALSLSFLALITVKYVQGQWIS